VTLSRLRLLTPRGRDARVLARYHRTGLRRFQLNRHALIVEEDPSLSNDLEAAARAADFEPLRVRNLADFAALVDPEPAVAVVSMDAAPELLAALLDSCVLEQVQELVICSSRDDFPDASRWIVELSAFFLGKPLDVAYVAELLKDAGADLNRLENDAEPSDDAPLDQLGLLRGNSRPMRRLYRLLRKVATTEATVLAWGESGTGKELVARSIHMLSGRSDAPFLAVNCGAIPSELVESELFGHEKGSFSGAARLHRGFFERVLDGTLFLDELTEMPADVQVKLLRVLESGGFRRVGGEEDLESRARIIAACNQDPRAAVARGTLREDLFYRVAEFVVRLPRLKDRDDDVVRLARLFLRELDEENGTSTRLASATEQVLLDHDWPGNVRELQSVVQRAYLVGHELIEPEDLPPLDGERPMSEEDGYVHVPVGTPLDDAERELIFATLELHGGNKQETAKALGISVKTLYNRLNRYAEEDAESASDSNTS